MSILSRFYGNRGYWHHLRGDTILAEKDYKKALQRGMNDPTRLGAYGVILMHKGEYEDSLVIMDKAIKNCGPKDLSARNNIRTSRALVYFKLGNQEKALAALNDLHENYRSAKVYQCLGYIYLYTNDLESALKYNLEAYDYDEFDPTILDNLGDTYYRMGDKVNARKFFELALEEKKDQVDIRYHMGVIEEEDGNFKKALKHFETADECRLNFLNDTTKEMIHAHIESCRKKLGETDEVIDEVEE